MARPEQSPRQKTPPALQQHKYKQDKTNRDPNADTRPDQTPDVTPEHPTPTKSPAHAGANVTRPGSRKK
ncbi:MAG: hypothetical protein ACFCVE_10650 [Phycisphaerae bacterium]